MKHLTNLYFKARKLLVNAILWAKSVKTSLQTPGTHKLFV